MIIISIDLETTGVNPETDLILEFGAVVEDTESLLNYEDVPKFNCIIERGVLSGSVFALNMNQRIIKILSDFSTADGEERARMTKEFNIIKEWQLAEKFEQWLTVCLVEKNKYSKKNNIAGKNYASFDGRFLVNVPGWKELVAPLFSRRIIDPSTLYVDWRKDEVLPSLDECLKRAGIEKGVTHTAVEDAWDVIQVLRNKYDKI